MKLSISIILNEIKQQYRLNDKVSNMVLWERVALNELVKHLTQYGYIPNEHTPSYRKHESKYIFFVLCVDNFGIKYIDRQHPHHILQTL